MVGAPQLGGALAEPRPHARKATGKPVFQAK